MKVEGVSENDDSRPLTHQLIMIRRLKNVAHVNQNRIGNRRLKRLCFL